MFLTQYEGTAKQQKLFPIIIQKQVNILRPLTIITTNREKNRFQHLKKNNQHLTPKIKLLRENYVLNLPSEWKPIIRKIP